MAVPSLSLPPGAPAMLPSFRTLAGSILGTPSFMSPEQIRATVPLDGRSDSGSASVAYYPCSSDIRRSWDRQTWM